MFFLNFLVRKILFVSICKLHNFKKKRGTLLRRALPLPTDYSNRLSSALSLRDPSLKHSILENHLDLYFINFVYFSNALERPIHRDMF